MKLDAPSGQGGEAAIPWGAFLGVTAALAVFGAAQGLSAPLFTLLMQRQDMSPALIGLSAAMMPVGLTLSAPFVPLAVRIAGGRQLAVACALAGAVCFVLIGLLQNWVAWFLLRFLVGVAINPLYVLGEVWALSLAPPSRRGRIMGIFNTVLSAGYSIGPLTLLFVGSAGWPPFLVIIVSFIVSAVLLGAVSGKLAGFDTPEGEGPPLGLLGFAAIAPALLLAVTIAAANQQSTYALMPVFGAAYGLPEATLATLITVLSLGNIVLQIPFGLAAEQLGGRFMLLFCASVTAICALLLRPIIHSDWIWPVLLVMGGAGYGVYTMALVELGSRFRGQQLVAGNAAFALMWGVGGIFGPPVTGLAMQAVGPIGMPAVIATLGACLVAFAVYRAAARRRA